MEVKGPAENFEDSRYLKDYNKWTALGSSA